MSSKRPLLCLLLFACLWLPAACSGKPAYPEARAQGDRVAIDMERIEDGRPGFFSFYAGGSRVDFFLLKSPSGATAFLDACQNCYKKKKGFSAREGRLYCNACGVSFSHEELEGIGSCVPIRLGGRQEGGSFVIDSAELLKASRYF